MDYLYEENICMHSSENSIKNTLEYDKEPESNFPPLPLNTLYTIQVGVDIRRKINRFVLILFYYKLFTREL